MNAKTSSPMFSRTDVRLVYRPEPTDYHWSAGQCFGTWGCLSGGASSTAAPAQQTGAPANPPAQQTKAPAAAPSAAAAQPASAQPAKSQPTGGSQPSQDSSSSSGGGGGAGGNVLSAITSAGMKAAVNDGSISTGASSSNPNKCTVKNQSGKDMLYVCWGSAGSWVNAKAPIIAQAVSSGSSVDLHFANTPSGTQGGACAPVFADTKMSNGQIVNTWVEATFNQYGTVDVSKEVTMSGIPVAVNTGSCTSNMSQCVFECTNGQNTCGEAGTYALKNPGPGCSGDTMNGGCSISGGSMTVTVG